MAHRVQMAWRAYVSRKRAWGRRRGRLEGRAAEILQAVLRQYVLRKRYQQTVIARYPQLFQQCTAWLKMYDRLRQALLLPEGTTMLMLVAAVAIMISSHEPRLDAKLGWAY